MDIQQPDTRDSEAFAWRVTENLSSRIAYVDSELRLRFANSTWLTSYGLGRDAIGRPLGEIVEAKLLGQWLPNIERVLSGETVENLDEITEGLNGKRWYRGFTAS